MLDSASSELHQLALRKLTNVLGAEHARSLMTRTLGELAMPHIETPHHLLQFADALRGQGGFIAAVGAMLGVAAVLRGATPTSA